MPAASQSAKTTNGESAADLLKKLLRLLRTGALDNVGQELAKLGAPPPRVDATWTDDAGIRFLKTDIPLAENHEYIRFATIAADTYDQLGLRELARKVLKSRQLLAIIHRDLETAESVEPSGGLSKEGWRLLRQKLYFWLQVSRSAYRDGDLDYARQCVVRCQRVAKRKLVPSSAGLSADISYRLATIARQEFKLDEAIVLFGECLSATFFILKANRQGASSGYSDNALAARYLVAKSSALGLGYCFIEKGMLREARIAISVGEILLWETEDWRNLQYCELLFARLLRHEAGRDPRHSALREEARQILRPLVENKPEGLRKPRFTLRAYYELGFVDLYSGRFAEAESNFTTVVSASESDGELRWHANGLVALARLRLYEGKAANGPADAERLFHQCRKLAIDGEGIAKRAKHQWSEARCILMQARAEMALMQSAVLSADEKEELRRRAKSNLLRVLEMSELSNPAVRALPLLLLTRLHALSGDLAEARRHYEAWVAIKPQVQYAAIQTLGVEVVHELFGTGRGFVVNNQIPDEELNIARLSRDLERYVLERLEARTDLTDQDRANIMGYDSRHTYRRHRKSVLGD